MSFVLRGQFYGQRLALLVGGTAGTRAHELGVGYGLAIDQKRFDDGEAEGVVRQDDAGSAEWRSELAFVV